MVRQAIAVALPPAHRYPTRIKPKLDGVAAFIDQVLDEDRRAPRKQLLSLPDEFSPEVPVENSPL